MNRWTYVLSFGFVSLLPFAVHSWAEAELFRQMKSTNSQQPVVQMSTPKSFVNQTDRALLSKEHTSDFVSKPLSITIEPMVPKNDTPFSSGKAAVESVTAAPLIEPRPMNSPATLNDAAPSIEKEVNNAPEHGLSIRIETPISEEHEQNMQTMPAAISQNSLNSGEAESSVTLWKERILTKLEGFLDTDDDQSDTPTTVLGIDGMKPMPHHEDKPNPKENEGTDSGLPAENPEANPKEDEEKDPGSPTEYPEGTPKEEEETTDPGSPTEYPEGTPKEEEETPDPGSATESPEGIPKEEEGTTDPGSATESPEGIPKEEEGTTDPGSATESPEGTPKEEEGTTDPGSATENPEGIPKEEEGTASPGSPTENPEGIPKEEEGTASPGLPTESPEGKSEEGSAQ